MQGALNESQLWSKHSGGGHVCRQADDMLKKQLSLIKSQFRSCLQARKLRNDVGLSFHSFIICPFDTSAKSHIRSLFSEHKFAQQEFSFGWNAIKSLFVVAFLNHYCYYY